MATKTVSHMSKAAHVAKYVAQHRDYCAQFRYSFTELKYINVVSGEQYSDSEYIKLMHMHLMTMTTRIIKEFA